MAAQIQNILTSSDPNELRIILRSMIHQITVTRQGTSVTGLITYYYFSQVPNKSPPGYNMSIPHIPLGAPDFRHTFTFPFSAQIRKWTKKHP
jgi:hypothetical protein